MIEHTNQPSLVERLKRGFGSGAGTIAQVAAYDRICREAATHITKIETLRDELLELAKLARKELVVFADDLKVSSTVCGEWDGTEDEAKEEYDRLMWLAAKLAEKVEAAQ